MYRVNAGCADLRDKIAELKENIAKEQSGLNRSNRIKMMQFDLNYHIKKLLYRQKRYKGNPPGNPNGRPKKVK